MTYETINPVQETLYCMEAKQYLRDVIDGDEDSEILRMVLPESSSSFRDHLKQTYAALSPEQNPRDITREEYFILDFPMTTSLAEYMQTNPTFDVVQDI